MRINHNIGALNTHRQLSTNTANQSKSIEKLSSGLRINRAGDDAAGLAISEKMRGQIRGLDQASRNAQDGISMIQTAEGALNETHSILQRMRELAVQSSNDTNTSSDRKEIQKEVDQLAQEITRIANNTEFNTQNLLNGGITSNGIGEVKFQIGANASQNLAINIKAMDAKSLGVSGDVNTATTTSVGGKVASVTYDNNNLGAKVVDGATISLTYTAAVSGSAAVAGEHDVTIGTADVTIDGTTFTYNAAPGATQWSNAAELAALVNADATLGAKYTATDDGGKLQLVQKAGYESATDPTATGTGVSVTEVTAGAAAVAASAAKVTITDGTTTQDVTVSDINATKLAVATGNYSGLTFDLGTNKISDLATSGTTDKVVVDVATDAATAATFDTTTKTKTADAVAKAGINVSTQSAASTAITTINTAIETVSAERSKLGAYQNRLEHTINNLNASSENLTASESRIRDVDMAKEMMEQTKNSILAQAAQAMLAQANQQPQGVLQLLR